MKKIICVILIGIIIAGIAITCTMGLKADIIFSKNAEIDIYVGKTFELEEMRSLVEEVFPNERVIVQEIEMFGDMISVTVADIRTEEDLKAKAEELNTKINEKYEVENATENIKITHNPKTKLSSVIKPYIIPVCISVVLILIYVAIRYKKLGVLNMLITYILSIGAVEAVLFSVIAITRFPVNRLVIPIGLTLYAITLIILGFINERKLNKVVVEAKKEK